MMSTSKTLELIKNCYTQDNFHALIRLAAADGWMDEAEMSYLQHRGRLMGLSRVNVSDCLKDLKNLSCKFPTTLNEQIVLVYEMACLMVSDYDLDRSEFDLCMKFCDDMGMDRDIAIDIIYEVEEAKELDELNDEILINILKRHSPNFMFTNF